MDIVNARLLAREDSLAGLPTVSRLASSFLSLRGQNAEGCPIALNVLLRELAGFEAEAEKCSRVMKSCDEELEHYKALDVDIESSIKDTQKEIKELRKQLEQERKSRRHKEECEAISKVVNAQPPRAETEARIAEIEAALTTLKESEKEINEKVAMRQKQFRLLLHSLFELKRSLAES